MASTGGRRQALSGRASTSELFEQRDDGVSRYTLIEL